MENCFTISLSEDWGMKKIIKWKKEQGKRLRNISNFAVIAFSMDDYDSYHFRFTESWSV